MDPKLWSAVVVTQNKFEAKIQADLIRDAGAKHVQICTNYNDGLECARRLDANIYVLALGDAPEDALTSVKTLRSFSGHPAQRAFVFATSRNLTASLIEQCRRIGANAAIGQPISQASLINTIKKVISKPRPFVDCEAYVGPCRRAGIFTAGKGQRRRKQDDTAQAPAPVATAK